MPLYDYRCHQCGETFEVSQKFADPHLTVHEGCGGQLERLISLPAMQFKGTGWYVTDYGRNGRSRRQAPTEENRKPSPNPTAESKSESKSEGKAESKSKTKSERSPKPSPRASLRLLPPAATSSRPPAPVYTATSRAFKTSLPIAVGPAVQHGICAQRPGRLKDLAWVRYSYLSTVQAEFCGRSGAPCRIRSAASGRFRPAAPAN